MQTFFYLLVLDSQGRPIGWRAYQNANVLVELAVRYFNHYKEKNQTVIIELLTQDKHLIKRLKTSINYEIHFESKIGLQNP